MISLPSGRVAGITSIRARYHALRLNRAVMPDTPRHELHRLVDIVTARPDERWLPGDCGYLFTGHTLDELPGLAAWSRKDRGAFRQWLQQETQIREIEQARRRIVHDELPLVAREYAYPQRLYSALQRRIEGLSLRRASARQWRQTLLNMRRSGIRDEELEWSGLLRFLDPAAHDGGRMIQRNELLSRIDFSLIRLCLTNELATDRGCGLEFVEVPQSASLNRLGAVNRIAGPGEVGVLRYVDTLHYFKVGYLKRLSGAHPGQGKVRWFALDSIGNRIDGCGPEQPYFSSREEAFGAANDHALQHVGLPVAYASCSRYEHKTLCGGEDYREWLLTLPDYPISYFNKHYYERNLLLHCRTKVRKDHKGRRLLFIEEVQSDWHQSGAVHGYQNRWPGRLPPAPFSKGWVGLALKLLLIHAAEKGFDGLAWTGGDVQESHYLQPMKQVRRIYDEEIPRCLKRLCRQWDARIGRTTITTKEPRVNITRQLDKWLITDSQGNFSTRPRASQQEAMRIMARHCKQIALEIPVLLLDQAMREQILAQGFPLFGELSAAIDTVP
jgi:hypothetical protein